MKNYLLILTMLFTVGCSNDTTVESSKTTIETIDESKIEFNIRSEDTKRNVKRVVEIDLQHRISEVEIKTISEQVKANQDKEYERTFLLFFIPDMKESAWATVSYDPDYKLNIIGSTASEHEGLNNRDIIVTGEKIGEWNANWGFEYKVLYEEKDGKILSRHIFSEGESKPLEMHIVSINGEKAYQDDISKDHGEYYIINNDGDLEYWSVNGKYYTAIKSK